MSLYLMFCCVQLSLLPGMWDNASCPAAPNGVLQDLSFVIKATMTCTKVEVSCIYREMFNSSASFPRHIISACNALEHRNLRG